MAWIANIAGKAEDFLNKIDQSTAVALKSAEDSASSSRSRSKRNARKNEQFEYNIPPKSYQQDYQSLPLNSGGTTSTSTTLDMDAITPDEIHIIEQESSTVSTAARGNINRSNSRPKPPRPSKLRNSNSLTTSETVETARVTDERNNSETEYAQGKIIDGLIKQKASLPNINSDDKLLEFLNSPSQHHLDESSMLKNEIATQSREMGHLLKDYKKLQQEHEMLKKSYELSLRSKETNKNPLGQEPVAVSLNYVKEDTELLLEKQLFEKNEELEKLRSHLKSALEKLEDNENSQSIKNRLEQIELEKLHLLSEKDELANTINKLSTQLETSEKDIKLIKEKLIIVENEYSTYKDKAKSILKSKDELIASMSSSSNIEGNSQQQHQQTFSLSTSTSSAAHDQLNETQFLSEIGSLRSERELLHAEITQNRFYAESLREENGRLETEVQSLRVGNSNLHSLLLKEKQLRHNHQEENLQLSQQISTLQLDFERIRIEKIKLEEKLENSLKSGNNNNSSIRKSSSFNDFETTSSQQQQTLIYGGAGHDFDETENLRTRITALSQSVLEKQNLINSLSSDKQLLQIRVERLQTRMQEMNQEVEYHQNIDTINFDDDGLTTHSVVSSQPLYLSESPWDSQIAKRVKRAYAQADTFCCQIGLILRRRPNIRLGFCVYILCLHLWVFFILFSWSHSHTPSPDNK